jgi:hypothetical protein
MSDRDRDADQARAEGWLSVIVDWDEDGQPDYFGVPPGEKSAERIREFPR